MNRFTLMLALLVLSPCLVVSQTATTRKLAQSTAAGAQKASPAKFKAIFEPVNYKQDLTLLDVFFVSKDEGWVSGAAGTTLHTKDGGNSWTAELGGDPQAQGDELKHLFFTNATHGWAQSWNTMFRSTQGENWQQVSGDIRGDAFFVSDVKGFRTVGGRMYATQNGGTRWKRGFQLPSKDGGRRTDPGEGLRCLGASLPIRSCGLCAG